MIRLVASNLERDESRRNEHGPIEIISKEEFVKKDINIRIESFRVDFLHAQEEAQLQIYRTSL